MLKIASIGDIHGREWWEQIIESVNDFDYIVFIGDYTDSWTKSNDEIKTNLLRIIMFKLEHPDKVILLLGNHDFSYIYHPDFECSGNRSEAVIDLKSIFTQYKDLFQIAFAYEKDNKQWLWTHAGITETFYHRRILKIAVELDLKLPVKAVDIADFLNVYVDKSSVRNDIAQVGISRGGFNMTGGPIWADWKKDLKKDPIIDINQIVGHSEIDEYTTINYGDYTITNIDCFMEDKEEKPYIIEI